MPAMGPAMHHGLPAGMPTLPAGLGPHSGLPQLSSMNPAAMLGMGMPSAMANQMAAQIAARYPAAMAQSGCVILVSNLHEEVCCKLVNCLHLCFPAAGEREVTYCRCIM